MTSFAPQMAQKAKNFYENMSHFATGAVPANGLILSGAP